MLFTVTHYLDNYVTAIAWALPAVVGAVFFCGFLLCAFGEIVRGKWPVPLTGATVLGLGILAAMLQGLREMRRDVLMDEPTEAHKRTGRDVDVQGCFKMEQIIVSEDCECF